MSTHTASAGRGQRSLSMVGLVFLIFFVMSLLTNILGPDAAELAPAMEQLMKTLETDQEGK